MRFIIRTCLALVAACGLAAAASAQTLTPMKLAGGELARLNIVILSDGFTQAEMPAFATEAQNMADALLNRAPFSSYKDLVNVYRIDVISAQSGITTTQSGTTTTVNSALGSTLGCFNIDRLLCANDTLVANAVASVGLQNSRIQLRIVIGNSTIYGGGGGATATVTRNVNAREVIVHEVGHTFAGLTDEYVDTAACTAGTYGAPTTQPNGSASMDRNVVPWKLWIDAGTATPTTGPSNDIPGVYAGGHYCDIYSRPTYDSLMRSLGRPFEKVNTEALIRRFYALSGSTFDSVTPSWTTKTINTLEPLHFAVLPKRLNGVALPVVWRVNGAVTAGSGTGGRELNLLASSLPAGANTVTVTVNDPTSLVRNDPQGSMTATRTWSFTVSQAQGRTDGLVLATLPSVRSVTTNATATAYATMINTFGGPLSTCKLQLNSSAGTGLTFSYSRTDPATNAVIGSPNATFSLTTGEVATFVFSIAASATSSGRSIPVEGICDGVGASEVNAANRFTLATSAALPADLISVSATPTTPGIVDLPANGGAAFFAVAALNIGAAASIDVRPVTSGEQLPIGLTVCETNPATSACLGSPGPALRVSFANNQTRTFAVFAVATGPVGFEPGNFRAALEMRDANGAALGPLRGSTSVAVRTTF